MARRLGVAETMFKITDVTHMAALAALAAAWAARRCRHDDAGKKLGLNRGSFARADLAVISPGSLSRRSLCTLLVQSDTSSGE